MVDIRISFHIPALPFSFVWVLSAGHLKNKFPDLPGVRYFTSRGLRRGKVTTRFGVLLRR